jgi:trk system potassium uptake protein TrkH
MGTQGKFSSFSNYSGNIYLNLIICSLIILGGLGYLTWEDILDKKFNFRRMNLQTKIILFTTAILIIIPFVYFILFEFNTFPLKERLLLSFFQSITPRTAGFNTAQYSQMSESSLLITIILMLIGGAPGSTAGGIKVTTVFVLIVASLNYLKNDDDVSLFKRRIDSDTIINAFTLLMVYTGLLLIGSIILSNVEHLPIIKIMFECASALGTVGLTTGITPYLGNLSKIILISFMFFGRVGGVTIAYALFGSSLHKKSRMPVEKVTVG